MVSDSLITDYQHLYYTLRNIRISREQALKECTTIINLCIEVMRSQRERRQNNTLIAPLETLLIQSSFYE